MWWRGLQPCQRVVEPNAPAMLQLPHHDARVQAQLPRKAFHFKLGRVVVRCLQPRGPQFTHAQQALMAATSVCLAGRARRNFACIGL